MDPPSLIQVTDVIGPPVEIKVRVNVGVESFSADVRWNLRESRTGLPTCSVETYCQCEVHNYKVDYLFLLTQSISKSSLQQYI